MKHTIEDLGDFAEDHGGGSLHIWKTRRDQRGINSSKDKPWAVKIGRRADTYYGATPDEAVDSALHGHERNRKEEVERS